MSDIESGGLIELTRRGFAVAEVEAGAGVMGPPGLRGPRGPAGDPGGTTVVVFAFGEEREPAELPEDGLIPAGWDGVRRPDAPIQLEVGQSVEYTLDGYLWTFLGPSAVPGGWIETGQMRGPPGERGGIGDTGPMGPTGPVGPPGQSVTGPPGPAGGPGPQGARGEIGPPGPAGATGAKGDTGERGEPGLDGRDGEPGLDGADGERGEQGEQGDPGEPGGPSFIVATFVTRTAADLAALSSGLVPADWDGPGRPATAVQMSPGQAWLDGNPADTGYYGQAIVFLGVSALSSAAWIPMSVTGPAGPSGPQGATGGQGPTGATGERGSLWHWSPFSPPTTDIVGAVNPGDMVLCLLPGGTGSTPGHGDVFHVNAGGAFVLDGNIRGPAGPTGATGPQGPPGEVSAAELAAVSARVGNLEARSVLRVWELTADRLLADGQDTVLLSQVLTPGSYTMIANIAAELDPPGATTTTRVITAWLQAVGAVIIDGPRAGEVTLHQALSYGSITLGPARIAVTGTGNAVLYVRSDQHPGQGAPAGAAVVKVNTLSGHAGATGAVATGG